MGLGWQLLYQTSEDTASKLKHDSCRTRVGLVSDKATVNPLVLVNVGMHQSNEKCTASSAWLLQPPMLVKTRHASEQWRLPVALPVLLVQRKRTYRTEEQLNTLGTRYGRCLQPLSSLVD
jgi:hypothetical protein